MKFRSAAEVEFVFDLTLTGTQWLMVENYIRNGIRPEAGCTWCDTGFIRSLTGDMDAFEGEEHPVLSWEGPIPDDSARD